MKTRFQTLKEKLIFSLCEATRFANEHKKNLLAMYAFALLASCSSIFALAAWEDQFPLWATTKAVLDVIYPLFVVVGIILLVVGIIMLFISRFNEQSITGPLIIIAVGIGLIVIRALLGGVIEDIAFRQMYPNEVQNEGWSLGDGGIPEQGSGN